MVNTTTSIITSFNGSARSMGSTSWVNGKLFEYIEKHKSTDIKLHKVDLYEHEINPISRKFLENDQQTIDPIPQDGMKELVPRIMSSKVIILATPIYWFNMSGQMKNFIDRWYDFSDEKGSLNLNGKGLVVVCAHANPSPTMPYMLMKNIEEIAKFNNMLYIGGISTVAKAQIGSNEYDSTVANAEILARRIVDFVENF